MVCNQHKTVSLQHTARRSRNFLTANIVAMCASHRADIDTKERGRNFSHCCTKGLSGAARTTHMYVRVWGRVCKCMRTCVCVREREREVERERESGTERNRMRMPKRESKQEIERESKRERESARTRESERERERERTRERNDERAGERKSVTTANKVVTARRRESTSPGRWQAITFGG